MTVRAEFRTILLHRMYHQWVAFAGGRRTPVRRGEILHFVQKGGCFRVEECDSCHSEGNPRRFPATECPGVHSGAEPGMRYSAHARLRNPKFVPPGPPPDSGLDSRLRVVLWRARGNDFALCLGLHQTGLPVTASSCQPSSSIKSPASLFPRRLNRIVPVESTTAHVGRPSSR